MLKLNGKQSAKTGSFDWQRGILQIETPSTCKMRLHETYSMQKLDTLLASAITTYCAAACLL